MPENKYDFQAGKKANYNNLIGYKSDYKES